MRSRDGTYFISCTVLSIIFFLLSTTFLQASDYLISYRYVVKDSILYNETLAISKSMLGCFGQPNQLLILESDGSSNLKKIISKNSIEFIDFIQTLGMQVENREITINARNKSTTILTLKTTCFKVDFNDKIARISSLK